jgi:hypothetical protein
MEVEENGNGKGTTVLNKAQPNLIEAALDYSENGFNPLPLWKKNAPALPEGHGFLYNPIDDIETRFAKVPMISIACGKVSDNFEALDFDAHKGQPIKKIFDSFIDDPGAKTILKKCSLYQTPSGGYHIYYRTTTTYNHCDPAHWDDGEIMIETRANGQYVVVHPSPNYKHIAGREILKIERLDDDERQYLIDLASSFTMKPKKEIQSDTNSPPELQTDTTDPVSFFNFSGTGTQYAKHLLIEDGWTEGENDRWTRPGKDEGTSATWDHKYNALFVFSSSVVEFKPQTYYTPFQILTRLRFKDNYLKAQQWIVDHYKLTLNQVDDNLSDLIELHRIDPNVVISEPEAVLTISDPDILNYNSGRPLATLGNFSCLIGKAKSRKTSLLIAFIVAYLMRACTLSNIKGSGEGKAVLFDTEQSPYHVHRFVKSVANQLTEDQLKNFEVFTLRTLAPAQRLAFIDYYLKTTENIGIALIDGIRDLLSHGINDETEATEITTKLLQWTGDYNIHIMTVLHQNKNDLNARGHIGTEIVNKAETTLSVAKNKQNKDISEVTAEYCRNMDFEPFAFTMDQDFRPVLVDLAAPGARQSKDSEIQEAIEYILKHNRSLRRTDLVSEYMELNGCTKATADRHIKQALTKLKIIERDERQRYQLKNDDAPF